MSAPKHSNKLLTEQDLKRIADDMHVGRTDYFYIPLFYSTFTFYDQREGNFVATQFPELVDKLNHILWFTLRYSTKDSPETLIEYASKVPADSTLLETLRHDLTKDFNYPESAAIGIGDGKSYWTYEDDAFIQPYDTATTKDGQELSRLLVMVEVDMFDVAAIESAGAHPFWKYEGDDYINLASIYYMGLVKEHMLHTVDPDNPGSQNALNIAAQFPDDPPYRLKM